MEGRASSTDFKLLFIESKSLLEYTFLRYILIIYINDLANTNSNLNVYIDKSQMITLYIDCINGEYSHKVIDKFPTKNGYILINFLLESGNSIGITPCYQSNSKDIWVYGRTTGTAVIYCYPVFIKN